MQLWKPIRAAGRRRFFVQCDHGASQNSCTIMFVLVLICPLPNEANQILHTTRAGPIREPSHFASALAVSRNRNQSSRGCFPALSAAQEPKANTLAFACGAGTASSHHHFPHGYVRSGSPACAVSRRRKLWAGYYSLKHEQDEAPKMGLCNILPFPFSWKPLAVEGAWHRRGYVNGSPQRANAMDCVGRFGQLSRRTLRHPDGSPRKERAPASCVRPPLLRAAWRRPPAFWPYREAPSSLSGWYNPSGARSCLSRPDGFSD